jgi:hypothetical protein
MVGMKWSRIYLLVGGWVAVVLSVWAAFATFNTFLVPGDPALTDGQVLGWKLGSAIAAAALSYLFFRLSRLAFRKAKN